MCFATKRNHIKWTYNQGFKKKWIIKTKWKHTNTRTSAKSLKRLKKIVVKGKIYPFIHTFSKYSHHSEMQRLYSYQHDHSYYCLFLSIVIFTSVYLYKRCSTPATPKRSLCGIRALFSKSPSLPPALFCIPLLALMAARVSNINTIYMFLPKGES